eukprot:TRINITY_DN1909_c0_g4_i1.p1 TRINITY_DN1909_c0_g4~~TRINITY_DN1909_c0_g4_i1.p1  ORF type:complete len:213 (+),score=41.00 TRINITY_DN1909_c0_g4_i1:106-744(+)
MTTKREPTYDYLVKLLIIGDSGVGKTNILLRICDNKYVESHLTTIGIDFKIKTIEVDKKKIKMQIWDTAGQDRFKTITQTYYKGAMGIILTYSINDRNSFSHIENWMEQIRSNANENVCLMLVANKVDLPNRVVEVSEGEQLASNYNIPFMETSAKNNINITELFEAMARQIKNNILDSEETSVFMREVTPNRIILNKDKEQQQGEASGCSC